MNGDGKRQIAFEKVKAVANATQAAAAGKKRRKGQDLKPIITNEPGAGSHLIAGQAVRGPLRLVGTFCHMLFLKLVCARNVAGKVWRGANGVNS